MSAESAALTRSWSVGKYTATMTVPKVKPGTVVAAAIEWSPYIPRRLTSVELDQYRAGRDAALVELAAVLQLGVDILEEV